MRAHPHHHRTQSPAQHTRVKPFPFTHQSTDWVYTACSLLHLLGRRQCALSLPPLPHPSLPSHTTSILCPSHDTKPVISLTNQWTGMPHAPSQPPLPHPSLPSHAHAPTQVAWSRAPRWISCECIHMWVGKDTRGVDMFRLVLSYIQNGVTYRRIPRTRSHSSR